MVYFVICENMNKNKLNLGSFFSRLGLLFWCLIGLYSSAVNAQEFSAMSYNIRYNNPADAPNDWDSRKAALTQLISERNPDFLGLQEALYDQLTYVNDQLGNSYQYIGVGRDDGKLKGEFSPLLYREDQWELLQSNTFWLSETPTKISVGWDAAMERICSYGYFKHKKTGQKIWVFNSHFDHVGLVARSASASLILETIKRLNTNKEAVLFMGDLNMTPEMEGIELLNKEMTDPLSLPGIELKGSFGTYTGFNTNGPFKRRIDYIFSQKVTPRHYEHLDQTYGEARRFPSDHFAVFYAASF